METQEKIREILLEIREGIDLDSDRLLVDDGVIDSFDVAALVNALNEEFDIKITLRDLVPENFNSIAAIAALVERLI